MNSINLGDIVSRKGHWYNWEVMAARDGMAVLRRDKEPSCYTNQWIVTEPMSNLTVVKATKNNSLRAQDVLSERSRLWLHHLDGKPSGK